MNGFTKFGEPQKAKKEMRVTVLRKVAWGGSQ